MTPATRKQAVEQGSPVYNTGRPCLHGHTANRYTSTGGCLECLRQHRLDYTATIREARRPLADRTSRVFSYRLHPDDHAAALAFCQALDMERGRMPNAAQAVVAPEPPRSATREEVAAHRERILGDLGALNAPPPRRHMPEEMRATLRAAGIRLGDEP